MALAACLIGGDQAGAWRVVEAALVAGARPVDFYHAMLAPALRIVGDRWAAGQITVADEHRASVVAMRLIGRLGVRCVRPGRTRGSVVLAAAPGDRHGLPTAMLADLLRAEGFHVTDLGADTPPTDVAAAAQAEDRLVGVGVCATSPLTAAGQRKLAQAVRAVHDRVRCPVLVGGAAVTSAQLAHRLGADGWSEHATDAIAWFASLAPPQGRAHDTNHPRPAASAGLLWFRRDLRQTDNPAWSSPRPSTAP